MAEKESRKTTKKKKRKIIPSTEFRFVDSEVSEVILTGTFTDWNLNEYRMRKYKGGVWKKKVKLKSGIHEYLFIVDGQWITDPENDNRTSNPFGSENSVIQI
jgi:1,4-alpha-glucan branching enzyme